MVSVWGSVFRKVEKFVLIPQGQLYIYNISKSFWTALMKDKKYENNSFLLTNLNYENSPNTFRSVSEISPNDASAFTASIITGNKLLSVEAVSYNFLRTDSTF